MTDLAGLPSALLGAVAHPAGDVGRAATGLEESVGQAAGASAQTLGGLRTMIGTVVSPGEHVVQPGETLGGIASAHGVSLGSMMSANPQVLHPDMIEAGAHLTVPAAPARSSEASPADAPASGGAGVRDSLPSSFPSTPASGRLAAGRPAPADSPATQRSGQAAPAMAQDAPGEDVGPSGPMLAALSRAGVDWRLLQQGAPQLFAAAGAGVQGATAPGAERGLGVLLQAIAADPLAAAALARILGDGKAAVLAVLTARLAMAPPLETAPSTQAGLQGASEAAVAPSPPGVDLAARAGLRPDGRRIAGADGHPAAETAQAGWIRRCAPAAIAVKVQWGVPAGFTIAHGALISDWGRLAPGNDYFGLLPVRAPGASRALVALAGPTATAFDSLDQAAAAFGDRLRGDARYAAAFRAPHPAAFAARLAADGLVNDPLYAPAMEAVIEAHALARFD